MLKQTKRKKPPSAEVMEARRNWGGRLLLELNSVCKKRTDAERREWLAEQIGYRNPLSVGQLITGQNGPSYEVYLRILEVLPEMQGVPAPPIEKLERGTGAPGPHKKHDYPKLGALESRRPRLKEG